MCGFVRNAISRLAVVLERPVFSQSLPILRHLSSANICKISGQGKTLCIMPSSTTECGKLEPASGIARGELRSTWAELAFAEVGVVYGRENFR